MADKKTKQTQQQNFNSSGSNLKLFDSKDIIVRRDDDSLKEISSVVLSKWTGENGKSSLKIKIQVTPIGYSRQFLSIDPSNRDLRKAIEDAYNKFDEISNLN